MERKDLYKSMPKSTQALRDSAQKKLRLKQRAEFKQRMEQNASQQEQPRRI